MTPCNKYELPFEYLNIKAGIEKYAANKIHICFKTQLNQILQYKFKKAAKKLKIKNLETKDALSHC